MPALSIQPNDRVTYAIAHQDDDLLVISKRSGLTTQPGLGHEDDTLLNGLFARFGPQLQNLGAARDFGLLHRLDKGTSGLLIVALRNRAYDAMREQFEQRKVSKFYWALCSKAPKQAVGMINKPLLEAESRIDGVEKKIAKISSLGKPAATAFRVVAQSTGGALIEARPLTGRLHQVRVHLESIGCPILGDTFYSPKGVAVAAPRLCLHAHRLCFVHPISGQMLDVRTKMPKEMKAVMRKIGLSIDDVMATLESQQRGQGEAKQDDED